MKQLCFILLSILYISQLHAQQFADKLVIRDYRLSQVISQRMTERGVYLYDSYGQTLRAQAMGNDSRYLFNAHEFDADLKLYLYPARSYSPEQKRFFQPDPESQYFSSYLFVASDPVNTIDLDGKAGKPLFIYGENLSYKKGKPKDLLDIQNEVGDAHYVSMSDFLEGKYGDVFDWNGNVYIHTHTATVLGDEFEVERARFPDRLKEAEGRTYGKLQVKGKTRYVSGVSSERLGKQLGDFSGKMRLKVRNIFAGGCEGGIASHRLARSYVASVGSEGDNYLSAYGLRKERYVFAVGKNVSKQGGELEGIERTRFHVSPVENGEIIDAIHREGAAKPKFDAVYFKDENGVKNAMPYIEGQEIHDMVHEARVPPRLKGEFEELHISY